MFNAWVGLGNSLTGHWNEVLLSTAKGSPDPTTDIPPALATLKMIGPINSELFLIVIMDSYIIYLY